MVSSLQLLGFALVLLAVVVVVIPNMLCFGSGISHGLRFIDWFYPWPQNHKPFLAMPSVIRSHILLNGGSLLLGLILLFPYSSPMTSSSFDTLLALYVSSLLLGSACSIIFSMRNAAHKLPGTVSFVFMALASVIPACCAAYAQWFLLSNTLARAHLVRSYAALFGAGVLFRLFAITLMPMVASQHKREAWIILIWGCWWLPSMVSDVCITPGLAVL